jgi:hypothetical protein
MADKALLEMYQEWIKIGKSTMKDVWDEADLCDSLLENKPEKDKIKVRILKRIARIFTDKCYSRNPQLLMVPSQPVIEEQEPIIDPLTNMPAVNPATGAIEPNLVDISGLRAEIISQAVNKELDNIGFKGEAKAVVHDAFVRPAGVLQIGYESNEERGVDSVYARRRSIKDIIIDRNAEIYNGMMHDGRFVGVRLKLTKKACKERGIDHTKLKELDQEEVSDGDTPKQTMVDTSNPENTSDENSRYCVWQMWNIVDRELAYVGENCDDWPKEPSPWPWDIKSFPVMFLSFDRIPDKKFGHSPLYDLQEQQEELDDTRTMLHENVVDSKPGTLFDKRLGEEFASKVADRAKNGYFMVEGLATMPGNAMQPFNTKEPINDLMALYSILKQEPYEVAGISDNDRMQQSANTTATEAEIVAAAGQLATGERIDTVEDLVRQAFKLVIAIMRQTYEGERVVQITRPDAQKVWLKWNPLLELQNYDADVAIGTGQRPNTDVEKKQALELYTTLARDPRFDGAMLGMDVLRAYGKKDPERYILPPQPMMPPQDGQEPPNGGEQ